MRTVLDIFAQIFRNLWAHKLRSFLTMFGIAWGVGSLLLLVGVGEGFRSGNKREMAEFGKDNPMGRAAQPEELAPAYVFLASNADSSYITGTVLQVMGGEPAGA